MNGLHVRLADRRSLAVGDVGPRDGVPVMYLHGAIGAPLECRGDLALALGTLGVRLLLPQRPGFGGSDRQPGRTLLDFAEDLEQVADRLGLERFAVVGVSAGGPYALATGHRLGERVRVAAVSSLSPLCAPVEVPGLPRRVRLPLRAIAAAPRLAAKLGDGGVALVARHPRLLERAMLVGAPPIDRRRVTESATRRDTHSAFLAATASGIGGLIDDHLVTSRPWGFALDQVRSEVHVWHGLADAFVPSDHALHLVASLPRCRAWFDPGEGHFFFRRRVREILGELSASGRRTASCRPAAGTCRCASDPCPCGS
ncbi:alpha/beta fold hydrolase [Solirubrobacter soli]|uniref:alpha/beta fold hydrolase n=1 Tax=Solirubrobacter soli TaxID=363832 RepID=UPI00069EE65D|nr:alpha/beta hydrolase [Solirubrobacter soli]